MEDWVYRAMQRWPNVPALFGWLSLDRRGRWRIQGEIISHPLIVQAINRNYAGDAHGRWFFQNGPQRGFLTLEYAPFLLRRGDVGDMLVTHTGLAVQRPSGAYLDEHGTLVLVTEHGPGELAGDELEWLMPRMTCDNRSASDQQLMAALEQASGEQTQVTLQLGSAHLAVIRLDVSDAPKRLGFVRDPQPLPDERISTRAMD